MPGSCSGSCRRSCLELLRVARPATCFSSAAAIGAAGDDMPAGSRRGTCKCVRAGSVLPGDLVVAHWGRRRGRVVAPIVSEWASRRGGVLEAGRERSTRRAASSNGKGWGREEGGGD